MSRDRVKRISELLEGISREERHPLLLYRPWEMQEPFHRSCAPEALLWGGKRSGKTVAISLEFVSRIFGRPITLRDGTAIPLRFPTSTRESPRQYWVIGWNWPHAATIFKYLFEPGQGGTLRAIRDTTTRQWRLFNRADPEDVKRENESELTPPLILPEMIVGGYKGIAWEEPKKRQWHSVRLTNGAVITYYPSNQITAQPGEAVAGLWIDEDIQVPEHLKEWQDRLADMEGFFLWSVWPQIRNNALLELMARAEACEGELHPQIEQFQLDMLKNPFISSKGKKEAVGRMDDDDEVARRTRGELMLSQYLMYETFAPIVHCLRHAVFDQKMQADLHAARWKLTEILMLDGRFPREWTRYLSIDPSFSRTAAHSWVIPPPVWDGVEMGRLAIVEWEKICLRKTADEIADELQPGMSGLHYEAFVMDQQIGKQTSVGRDETVFAHFEESFRKKGLVSRQTLSGFLPGCNEPPTRHRTIRRMLATQPNGMPMILFVEDRIPITKAEFGRYSRKVERHADGTTVTLDSPAVPRKFDAMASVEYGGTLICSLLDQDIAYVEPTRFHTEQSAIIKKIEQLRERDRNGPGTIEDGQHVHLGPGRAA
jgi:hypothetical protein